MHPEIARSLIAQHQHDLRALGRGGDTAAARPRATRRPRAIPRIPYWRITWSRVAVPASGTGGQAWLIVISARPARSAQRIA